MYSNDKMLFIFLKIVKEIIYIFFKINLIDSLVNLTYICIYIYLIYYKMNISFTILICI